MIKFKQYILLFIITLILPACNFSKSKRNPSINFVIVDCNSEQTIKMFGDCQTQESPCSTFKIALSLMGFDAKILKNENEPEWPYKDEYNAKLDIWQQSHAPKTWIQSSCVWYSQVLTLMLGMEKFQNYVNNFKYGNKDLAGNLGKNDGLSKSWLCSSLKISPLEQIEFIKKLLQNKLPVSEYAHEQTKKILFHSDLGDGWKLYAKSGGGFYDDPIKSIGWFVGWISNATKNKTFIFTCLLKSEDKNNTVNGHLAKKYVGDFLNQEIIYKQS